LTKPAKVPVEPLRLRVTDREGFIKGYVIARVGLRSVYGVITRVSARSVWATGKDGVEWMYRAYDGRLPSVLLSRCPKAEFIDLNTVGVRRLRVNVLTANKTDPKKASPTTEGPNT
jgi:hypothetical protein